MCLPAGSVQVFCTDIDGDGYMDVVTADKSKNATTLYYNNLVVATHTLPSGNNNSGAHPSSPYCALAYACKRLTLLLSLCVQPLLSPGGWAFTWTRTSTRPSRSS